MKSSTKILIGVGVLAAAGAAYFFLRKKDTGAFDPEYSTDSTSPGDHFKRYMTPPRVATVSVALAKKKQPVFVPPFMPPIGGGGDNSNLIDV